MEPEPPLKRPPRAASLAACCLKPTREEPWPLQTSSWGKACQQEKDLETTPHGLSGRSGHSSSHSHGTAPQPSSCVTEPALDLEAIVQGSIVAVLDLHQKRTEELHGQVLARLADIELQILRVGEIMDGDDGFTTEVTQKETAVEEQQPPRTTQVSAVHGHVIRGCTTMATRSVSNGEMDERIAFRKIQGKLQRMVRSNTFEVLVTVLIMLSVFVSFLELEWEGYLADVALGLSEPGLWRGAEGAFLTSGHLFNCIFFMEFALRILAGGFKYLRDPWAWFDAFFVVASVLDDHVLTWFSPNGAEGQQNVSVLRLVRCARMARTFRAAKGVRAVRPLILLVQTILGSMVALFWSTVFLFLVQLMGAIFVAKSLHGFVMDESQSEEDRLWVNRIFGSGLKSLYTFFEITFSGGWPNHVRPLMEKVGWLYALFFVLYVAVWAFVIMRVIGALFIKETLATAEKVESARHAHEAERRKMTRKIADYFKRANISRVGAIGAVAWEELEMLFEDPSVKSWCRSHDIDLDDAQRLWMLLSSKGSLSVTEFVDGLLRMRDPAKAIDIKALLQSTRELTSHCETIEEKVSAMEARLGSFEVGRKKFMSESSRNNRMPSERYA